MGEGGKQELKARVANAAIKASVRGSGDTWVGPRPGHSPWARLSEGEKSHSACDGQAGVSWAEGPADWSKGREQRQEVVARRRY